MNREPLVFRSSFRVHRSYFPSCVLIFPAVCFKLVHLSFDREPKA